MGSALGQILANIFVGQLELEISERDMPLLFDRFVDDTFAIFTDKNEATGFFNRLNQLHPSLKFTTEWEKEDTLPVHGRAIQKGTESNGSFCFGSQHLQACTHGVICSAP